MPKILPFAPMPMAVLKSMSTPFMRVGVIFPRMFPSLGLKLKQAELGVDEREYSSMLVFLTIFYFAFFTLMFTLIFSKLNPELFLLLGPGLGLILTALMIVQMVIYPTLLIRKKSRDIERNLVFALRAILVQIKSGISLFDGMNTVANGDYGTISVEFKRAVDRINTGFPAEEALEDMAKKNPSPFFRKALWQIVNGMKAGADISAVLSETVASMIRDQKIAITKYGAQLRVLSLLYMMIGIIVPALGLTLMIVLLTFPMVGEAITGNESLVGITETLQGVIPGETYVEGGSITGLVGKQNYSGKPMSIAIEMVDEKVAFFALMVEEEGRAPRKIGESIAIYGEVGGNLREQFKTEKGVTLFDGSIKVKSIGLNLFGQPQVEITRIETSHMLFWGMLAFLAVMQFMYVGIIKSRRPNLVG